MNSPQRWIAFLRLVVGFWFVKTVWTKLALFFAWGVIPYIGVSSRFIGFHPKRVAEFAAGNPLDWYRQFLEGTVLPNATLFAKLQAFGEALVGAALVLGLFTRLAAVIGLFLTLNYGLATQWMSFGQQGFHVMLVASMIIFIGAAAGRAWGIDQLILRSAVSSKRRWLKLFLSAALVVTVLSPMHSGDAAEWRVFVSSEKSNDVTVIGTEEKVLATIAVGQRPRGVTASHDGAKVYVANSDSNNISVIDAASLRVVDTLPGGIDPEGVTIDGGGRLYAVNENDSALTIVDVNKREIIKRLEVGTEPETAVLSPDGKVVAISNETSNEVHLLDTASGTIMGKVSVPRNPRGMRFTADSRQLYVASEQAHVISIIDVIGRELVKSVPTGGERPVDIVFSKDEKRLFVSHGASGDVRVFEAGTLKPLQTIAVGPRAWWMALTPDGSFLYVTVGRANEVVMIDTRSNTVAAHIKAGILPWGIAIVQTQ